MPTTADAATLAPPHSHAGAVLAAANAGPSVAPMRPADMGEVARLHDVVFGPGAYTRTAYRVREASPGVSPLSLVSRLDGELIASICFTDITVGGTPGALLLGPLVVATRHAGRGFGKALVAQGLEAARHAGISIVLLVGNEGYYARFGFQKVPVGQIRLPGPVDYARLLAAELEAGALAKFSGMIEARR
jgi:predicted N-acetyltransferase YhbS